MRNLVDLVFWENAPAIITWLIIIIMIIVESHILRVILMHRYHSVSKKEEKAQFLINTGNPALTKCPAADFSCVAQ